MVGVGFLGGGTIVKEPRHIRGLTTAAGIWAMAGVGLLVGSGQYWLGVSTTLLVLLLFGAEHLDKWLFARMARRAPIFRSPRDTAHPGRS